MKITLICVTTGDNDYSYGVLVLTKALARQLLDFRTLFTGAQQQERTLSAMEFLDETVAYGFDLNNIELNFGDPNCWYTFKGDPGLSIRSGRDPVGGSVIRILQKGVLWTGYPIYTEGSFETPVITWDKLEAVVTGKNLFDPPPEDEEVEETDLG